MTAKTSKSNENLEFFNARIDEIRMSGHERLKAKARLARAEAFADAAIAVGRAIRGLFQRQPSKPIRPARRMTHSAG